ncbi:PRC-barrel domain-containing protein [Rhodoligotrophos defluvii]|uniref:PRC-barrel domain-containing protein n=1 Tax=Rhodoligotrophos defluvii TaxID=2561934 RepID=UPI0010C9F6E5|nr:PRC-barrel domain-containing protein [Rhodoligotrophos defluvii]
MKADSVSQTIAAAFAIGLLGSIPAEAQDQQQAQTQQNSDQQQTSQGRQTGQAGQEAGQNQRQAQQGDRPPVLVLEDWSYNPLYSSGWSAERLMEADVIGTTGDEIGDVENLIVSDKGKVLGIIAEVGGFLDIGDTHLFIPWGEVSVSPDLDRVTVPVTEENAEDYSLFKWSQLEKGQTGQTRVVEDDLQTGPRIWKATELLNDDAYLNDDIGYGYVSDLIFTTDGNLHAVVVSADAAYGGGYYAYPYYGYGYGWAPGSPYYDLGYDREEIATLERFDYDKLKPTVDMEDDAITTGSTSQSGQGASGQANQKQ